MNANDTLKSLLETLDPTLEKIPPDLNQEIKNVLSRSVTLALNKFDFVPYEELRVQKKVLQKTRAKVEALEKQLDTLLKEP